MREEDEDEQCLLLGEACLAACSRGWVQHCGMTLLLNFIFLPLLSVHKYVSS